jgi:hypothetical protein
MNLSNDQTQVGCPVVYYGFLKMFLVSFCKDDMSLFFSGV